MYFETSHNIANATFKPVSLRGNIIEEVTQYKYLGIMLDQHLWKKGTLRKIRKYINKPTSLYLYKSLIEPCFSFNDIIYDTLTQQDQQKLQVLQNICLRTCLNADPRTHRADLFHEANVLPLDVQRKLHTASYLHVAARVSSLQ